MATASTVVESRDSLPYIAFATNEARFASGPAPYSEDSWTTMRVVIAELGHAEWGLIVSEINSTVVPKFLMMIDQTFWFEANEVLGIVQIARLSAVPNGNWMTHRFEFPNTLDFSDCVRAISEAKSHVLYHRLRMIDGLTAVFEQQSRTAPVTQADRASAAEEATASGPVAAGEVAEDGDGAPPPPPQ